MANKIVSKQLTSGWTVYLIIRDLSGLVWDNALADGTVTAINTIAAADAKIAMTEAGTSGQYSVTIPATLTHGVWEFSIRRQTGGSPVLSPTDPEQELQRWFWDGTGKLEASQSVTEIDDEPVPAERTFILRQTAEQGLMAEAAKSAKAGTSQTFAIDFRNDSAANARIRTVGTPTFVPDTGVTVVSTGRFGVQAKLRLTLTTEGDYTVVVPVTYATGNSAKGTVTVKVVE